MVEFGEFLRMKRKAKKMTIRQLALYAGCSSSYLSLLERGVIGERGPTPNFLRKLVKPLEVPYEVLMTAAGYQLQAEDETLYSGSVVMVLRESFGDDVKEFSRRTGKSVFEIETLEQQGVSYETLHDIFSALFGRERLFTPSQKDLLYRIEETLLKMGAKNTTHVEEFLDHLLSFLQAKH